MKHYEHRQFGYLTMAALTAALIMGVVILSTGGMNWIALGVLVVLGAALVTFSSLTVIIWDDALEIRFGPGLIHRKFRLQDVESCRAVKNSWYYGWGIRLTPHGWLYNVSGLHAVEVRLKNGRQYRIGTDVLRELEQALQQVISNKVETEVRGRRLS